MDEEEEEEEEEEGGGGGRGEEEEGGGGEGEEDRKDQNTEYLLDPKDVQSLAQPTFSMIGERKHLCRQVWREASTGCPQLSLNLMPDLLPAHSCMMQAVKSIIIYFQCIGCCWRETEEQGAENGGRSALRVVRTETRFAY